MSELLWRNSTAHATASPCLRDAPASPEASSASAGRRRLPPGKTAYSSASLRRPARGSVLTGRRSHSASSICSRARRDEACQLLAQTFTLFPSPMPAARAATAPEVTAEVPKTTSATCAVASSIGKCPAPFSSRTRACGSTSRQSASDLRTAPKVFSPYRISTGVSSPRKISHAAYLVEEREVAAR